VSKTTLKGGRMSGAPSPGFPGVRKTGTDFDAVRQQLQTGPLYIDIDLTTARSLTAGTALTLPINGNSLFVDQKPNSGYATCYVQDTARAGNTPVTLYPGAVFHVPFTQLLIENIAQPGLSLRVVYGVDIDFTPALSAGFFGSVSVVDDGKARTLAGVAFVCAAGVGAVAATYTSVQIYNPPASGKNLFIENLTVASDVAGGVGMRRNNVPLLSLPQDIANKYIGQPIASGKWYYDNTAGIPGFGPYLYLAQLQASVTAPPVQLREPLLLVPGEGVSVTHNVVNTLLYVNAEILEETV